MATVEILSAVLVASTEYAENEETPIFELTYLHLDVVLMKDTNSSGEH